MLLQNQRQYWLIWLAAFVELAVLIAAVAYAVIADKWEVWALVAAVGIAALTVLTAWRVYGSAHTQIVLKRLEEEIETLHSVYFRVISD